MSEASTSQVGTVEAKDLSPVPMEQEDPRALQRNMGNGYHRLQLGAIRFRLSNDALPLSSVGGNKIEVQTFILHAYTCQTNSTAQVNCCISTGALDITGISLLQGHVSVGHARVSTAYGYQTMLSTKSLVSGLPMLPVPTVFSTLFYCPTIG